MSYGICQVCACTDLEGCPEGCGWTGPRHDLCSVCAPLNDLDRQERREVNRQDLLIQIGIAEELVASLRERLAVLQPKAKGRAKWAV